MMINLFQLLGSRNRLKNVSGQYFSQFSRYKIKWFSKTEHPLKKCRSVIYELLFFTIFLGRVLSIKAIYIYLTSLN